jgi:hypothetical protein
LIYGVSKYRLALHSQNWHATADQWKSLLGDPNCVDQACPPKLETNVLLGSIFNTGTHSYDAVYGNVISMSYVDSVQNMGEYDTLGHLLHWDWSYPRTNGIDAPYDDTLTIGFKACTKVFGAVGVAALGNFTVAKHAVVSRNGVQIDNLYLGAFLDYDVLPNNKNQMTGYDAAHSMGWVYDCGSPTTGWGSVKVPFGCGYTPMLNAKTIESQQANWNDSDIFLDSMYYWMHNNVGLSHQPGSDPCQATSDDRAAYWTYQVQNVPAADTAMFAYAFFGMPGITNADQAETYFAEADMINKWCGFGRGDVNNDGKIDIVDIVYLANYVTFSGDGPNPFLHLGDVNDDGDVDVNDVAYLKDFYFNFGPCPLGSWMF